MVHARLEPLVQLVGIHCLLMRDVIINDGMDRNCQLLIDLVSLVETCNCLGSSWRLAKDQFAKLSRNKPSNILLLLACVIRIMCGVCISS